MQSRFKTTVTTQTVDTIFIRTRQDKDNENKIDLNPPYQRKIVWEDEKQSNFINSICKGIIPNNLIFNIDLVGNYVCIDGKQRISSIIFFRQNEIPLILEDESKHIYYNKIPEDKKNCRTMTQEEKNKFNNTEIPVVTYNNLTYEEQIDVFSRIQNGVKLTKDDIMVSMFKTENAAIKFKDYCHNKENYFKKFSKIHVDKKEHYSIILNIMYIFDTNNLKLLDVKQRKQYLINKDIGYLNKMSKMIDDLINICFDDDLLGHSSITKSLYNNLIYALCYSVYKSHNKMLNKLTAKDKKILLSTTRKIHRALNGKAKDGTVIKKEQIKTLENCITKFENLRKDLKNSNVVVSDDEADEEEIETSKEELDE